MMWIITSAERTTEIWNHFSSTCSRQPPNSLQEPTGLNYQPNSIRWFSCLHLQLRLFYNILGCQDPKMIEEFSSIIQSILNLILELLQMLKQIDVTMPDSLKALMKAYTVRVEKIDLLMEHLIKIKDGNLI